MKPMNGLSLTWLIAADGDFKYIPVVLVAAVIKTENVLADKEAGGSNYIIKPFNLPPKSKADQRVR